MFFLCVCWPGCVLWLSSNSSSSRIALTLAVTDRNTHAQSITARFLPQPQSGMPAGEQRRNNSQDAVRRGTEDPTTLGLREGTPTSATETASPSQALRAPAYPSLARTPSPARVSRKGSFGVGVGLARMGSGSGWVERQQPPSSVSPPSAMGATAPMSRTPSFSASGSGARSLTNPTQSGLRMHTPSSAQEGSPTRSAVQSMVGGLPSVLRRKQSATGMGMSPPSAQSVGGVGQQHPHHTPMQLPAAEMTMRREQTGRQSLGGGGQGQYTPVQSTSAGVGAPSSVPVRGRARTSPDSAINYLLGMDSFEVCVCACVSVDSRGVRVWAGEYLCVGVGVFVRLGDRAVTRQYSRGRGRGWVHTVFGAGARPR